MKTILKSLTATALSAMILFSVGCNTVKPEPPEQDNKPSDSVTVVQGEFMVKDGKSDYAILHPQHLTENLKLAVEELQEFVYRSTGVTLAAKTQVSAGEKFISLGKTEQFENTGLKAEYADLGDQGFVIDTEDKNVYVCGARDLGTLYGVYEFLETAVDFDVYGPECTDYAAKTEIPLYDFSVSDKPAINYYMNAYGFYGDQGSAINEQAVRLRINKTPMYYINGNFAHTATKYFTADDFEQNEEWLGTCKNQLCYTARGKADKFNAMVDHVVEYMQKKINANPNQHFMPFMQEDYVTWCDCPECTKVIADHGGFTTSTQILFINEVAKKLKPWLKENHPESDIRITFFAYNNTTSAPVKTDANGNYVPYSDDLVLEDIVSVFFAPIGANYYYSFKDDANNSYRDTLERWDAISDTICSWLYSTNFKHYLMPFDNFGGMQETYRKIAESGTVLLFENSQYDNNNATAFHVLKAYLNAKLRWDPYVDYNALIDKWFDGYFKTASDTMQAYFDSLRGHIARTQAPQYLTGDVYYGIEDKTLWPYSTLKGWEKMIDRAYLDAEALKGTPEYEIVRNRILTESIFVRYALIQMYPTSYNQSALLEMKKSFKTDAMRLNFSRVKEGTPMSSLYSSWGI